MEHYLLEPPCVLVLFFFLCIYQRLPLSSKVPLHCKGLIPLICVLQKHCPTGSLGCLHYSIHRMQILTLRGPQGRMDITYFACSEQLCGYKVIQRGNKSRHSSIIICVWYKALSQAWHRKTDKWNCNFAVHSFVYNQSKHRCFGRLAMLLNGTKTVLFQYSFWFYFEKCTMTVILGQQMFHTLWLQPRRGTQIGVTSVLLWCPDSLMMTTIFDSRTGSRFLITTKVGQENSQTSEYAPVMTSTSANDSFHFTTEAFWSISMWYVQIIFKKCAK